MVGNQTRLSGSGNSSRNKIIFIQQIFIKGLLRAKFKVPGIRQ